MKTVFITLFLAVVLVGIALTLLAIKVLFVKGGKFSSAHAHDLPRLRRQARERLKQKVNSKHNIQSNQ
jgi:hypothetical protein